LSSKIDTLTTTNDNSQNLSPVGNNSALGYGPLANNYGTPAIAPNDGSATLSAASRARLVQRVAKAFEAASDNGGTIRLRLSPPELGSLKIEIRMEQGQMHARLETDSEQTRSVLLDNLPALRDRLQQQDITVTRFDVDLAGQSGGGALNTPDRSWQQNDGGSNAGAARPNIVTPELTTTTDFAPAPLVAAPGQLNVMI
jgi:flagellar hook-length control protein FliK